MTEIIKCEKCKGRLDIDKKEKVAAFMTGTAWICPACAFAGAGFVSLFVYYCHLAKQGKNALLEANSQCYPPSVPGAVCLQCRGAGRRVIAPSIAFLVDGQILCVACLMEFHPALFDELLSKGEKAEEHFNH